MNKKIVIIAGEESGDYHAAQLIKALLKKNPSFEISGIGGKHMRQAGANVLCDLARHGVTGVTEVLRYLPLLYQAMKKIRQHLSLTKPDLLILVDYPGFNLRLAKFAKQRLGLRIIYYISPQIWAWKPKRLQTIRQNIDHMAVILPFEKAIYQQANVPVSFVGHPLIETLAQSKKATNRRSSLRLPLDKTIVAFLPGSRKNELQRHMPVFIETMRRLNIKHQNLQFVIPVAESLTLKTMQQYIPEYLKNIVLISGKAVPVIQSSDCVVVASGTASLECALQAKPMCIVYKASWLSYLVAMKVLRVKYLGLCNLLQNYMLVPELLQDDCNPQELSLIINQLLSNSSDLVTKMEAGFKTLQASLSTEAIDETLVDLVTRYLHHSKVTNR